MKTKHELICHFMELMNYATRVTGVCVQWSETGIDLVKVEKGESSLEDMFYSCVTADGDDSEIIARDLIFDD
jgi:hypothetical protein